ncbi:hypothetical protein BJ138DRAFT_1168664, partial [Hygrophoropsis aurantiaca]
MSDGTCGNKIRNDLDGMDCELWIVIVVIFFSRHVLITILVLLVLILIFALLLLVVLLLITTLRIFVTLLPSAIFFSRYSICALLLNTSIPGQIAVVRSLISCIRDNNLYLAPFQVKPRCRLGLLAQDRCTR